MNNVTAPPIALSPFYLSFSVKNMKFICYLFAPGSCWSPWEVSADVLVTGCLR